MTKSLFQWLSYIETLHPKTIELGLDRIFSVAEKLDVLNFTCPVVTIAGTNGKGSCVAFLESIAQAAGYRVGAYTSPHLLRFNERIRIAGREVEDADLVKVFAHVEAVRGDIPLTYFEFTTLAALYLFSAAQLDLLVLEVGLGGRLDAVNIVELDVAIITSIALDHMDWLGSTREAIGYEKAGIFRANKPAICGDPDPPQSVKDAAKNCQAMWYNGDFVGPELLLPKQSAVVALMAIECLQQRLPISRAAIDVGLKNARLPGRFQRFQHGCEIILDVAHNPEAATYLAQQLLVHPLSGKTRALVGMLADKDICSTLQPLLSCVDEWYVVDLGVARGAEGEIIANYLHNLGVSQYYSASNQSVVGALQAVLQVSQPQDRVLVFGSFHTVAPVLEFLTTVSLSPSERRC